MAPLALLGHPGARMREAISINSGLLVLQKVRGQPAAVTVDFEHQQRPMHVVQFCSSMLTLAFADSALTY